MSTPVSPVEHKLPTRSATVSSSLTRQTSVSDDEAIPDTDSNETTNLLLERLRAWKHVCGNLEDYVSMTAKISKSQSKDHEKILKTVSEPLKEGNQFSSSSGGVTGLFENMRNNTQGMINMYLETEQNLKGSVLPTLERLHKEIKAKSKELKSGAVKGAKAVEKARQATQKHIELLGQHSASHDAAARNKIETHHDPYILRRGINHRLNKQVTEENNHRNDILAVQNSFAQFEAHVLQTIQGALDQFFQFMGGQLDRQRAMYADILGTAQLIPADFEWMNFCVSHDAKLVNPDSPPRSFSSITYPNMDHRSTQPLIEGSLERRSRAIIKGYSTGYYVVTPAGYLHEFNDTDDFRKDPTPELSLYLPDCIVGAIDGVKFNVKGKDVSSGKVGNAFHTTTELSFKAHSPNDAEKWWTVIKDCTRGPVAARSLLSPLLSLLPPVSPAGPSSAEPPCLCPKRRKAAAAAAASSSAAAAPAAEKNIDAKDHAAASPTVGLSRTTSTASHFHGSPGGSAVQEKS
ncbi:PH domain protein [Penicillium brasilianum]|uniref:PH domain protein n=1 Tax=Penicillium brasilianum TaxID=104259 RepID=A0A1S9RG42_PENBI|nr:PH domain protein [Penicillium brasilianum]